jgi:hypothetical protein
VGVYTGAGLYKPRLILENLLMKKEEFQWQWSSKCTARECLLVTYWKRRSLTSSDTQGHAMKETDPNKTMPIEILVCLEFHIRDVNMRKPLKRFPKMAFTKAKLCFIYHFYKSDLLKFIIASRDSISEWPMLAIILQ